MDILKRPWLGESKEMEVISNGSGAFYRKV